MPTVFIFDCLKKIYREIIVTYDKIAVERKQLTKKIAT